MTTWDPFGTNSQEIPPLEGWAPSWEEEKFHPIPNDLRDLHVEDFFADMAWVTDGSLKGHGTEAPPSPKKLSEDLALELEFAEDPGCAFHNYFKDPIKRRIESAILTHLTRSRRFLDMFINHLETFQIEEEAEFEILYHSVINHFGARSKEASRLYFYGAKTFKRNSLYSEALLVTDPEAFLEHASEFDLEPNPQLMKQISKQGMQYHLRFAASCGYALKWLEHTPLEPLIPFLEEMPVPFSWQRFAENMRRFDKSIRGRFFQTVETLVDLDTACEVFSMLELENDLFARRVFLASPRLFAKMFQSKLFELAENWIDTREIFQEFPFALIEEEEKRAQIAYQLAQKDPFQLIGCLPSFKCKNEELFMPTLRILAEEEPKEFVLIMEKLHIRSRKNLEELANLLLKSETRLTADTKENFALFLREFLSLRLGEKKETFLKYLFQQAGALDLEMLFAKLPETQKKTKCVNAFAPTVFARFVRGKSDTEWEKKIGTEHRLFRDNIHAEAAFVWMCQVQELKERFADEDIELILNQLFFDKESIPKRLDLLRSLLELRTEELLAIPTPLPLAALENMFRVRGIELLDLPKEKAILLMEKVLKWRSPFALFKFLIKVDTLETSKRVVARSAVREFLLHYLDGTYETWRYERSPHLQAMRDQGFMDADLEEWWKRTPASEDFDSQHTIEITSDPVDFFLCGDECGGCQRLSNDIQYVLPILGLMDGMFKMVVIRNKQTKKMITRSFVRWMSDKEGQKPALLLEPPYTLNYNIAHAHQILSYLKKQVKMAPREFPLVISHHFIKAYNHPTTPFPHPLYAEGSFAPLVFSDTLGFEKSGGEGGIKTDGHYVLHQAATIL